MVLRFYRPLGFYSTNYKQIDWNTKCCWYFPLLSLAWLDTSLIHIHLIDMYVPVIISMHYYFINQWKFVQWKLSETVKIKILSQIKNTNRIELLQSLLFYLAISLILWYFSVMINIQNSESIHSYVIAVMLQSYFDELKIFIQTSHQLQREINKWSKSSLLFQFWPQRTFPRKISTMTGCFAFVAPMDLLVLIADAILTVILIILTLLFVLFVFDNNNCL